MPSGKKHDEIWLKLRKLLFFSSIVVFCVTEFIVMNFYSQLSPIVLSLRFASSTILTIGYLAGVVISRYITPDMDLVSITTTEYTMMRKFGLLGVLFVMYWMPYGHIMKHREKLSHMYIISSFVRALYGAWWALAPLTLPFYTLWFGIALGMSTGDAIHIWYDNNYVEKKGKLIRRKI